MPDAFYSFLLLSSWNFNKTGKNCGRNRNCPDDDSINLKEYGVSKKLLYVACWMVDEGLKIGSSRRYGNY